LATLFNMERSRSANLGCSKEDCRANKGPEAPGTFETYDERLNAAA